MGMLGEIHGTIHSGILGGGGIHGVLDGDGMPAGDGTVGPGMDGAGVLAHYGVLQGTMDMAEGLFTLLMVIDIEDEMWYEERDHREVLYQLVRADLHQEEGLLQANPAEVIRLILVVSKLTT